MKKIILTAATLVLVGCASAADPGAMMVSVSEATIIDQNSKLYQSVSLDGVEGGKETNPLWASKVSNDDFAEALSQSLSAHTMLATGDGDYLLAANLEELKQPFGGIDLKVTSTVQYTLTNVATGEVVFKQTLETPYTAAFSDAFVAVERLKLANEGAIKENISALIKTLIENVDAVSIPVAALSPLTSADDA